MENNLEDGLLLLKSCLDSPQSRNEPLSYQGNASKPRPTTTFADHLVREHRLWNRSEVLRSDYPDGNCETGRGPRHGAVEIRFSNCLGRYLVASRDIAAGEVVLQEEPLLIVPKAGSEPTCLACLKVLASDWNGCEECGGPVCSQDCGGPHHASQECNLIRRMGFKHSSHRESHIKELNIILGPLRALLLIQESPPAKELFFALQSHEEKRKKMQIGSVVMEHIVKVLHTRLGLEVESELVHRVCGVLDTNSFDVPLDNDQRGRAIFIVSSMMNHSCVPNVQRWYFNGDLIVRASVDIAKGAPILINYTQCLWGTRAREAHLIGCKMFICKCQRCLDPTELGSHMSSIPCPECQVLMVPPAGCQRSWTCLSCGKSTDPMAIESMVGAGAVALRRLPRDDPSAIKTVLSHLSRLLGQGHFIVCQIKYALIQAIMSLPLQEVDSTDLIKVLELTRELLKLASIVEPGLTRFRGLLLLEQIRASYELLERAQGADVAADVAADVEADVGDVKESVEVNRFESNAPFSRFTHKVKVMLSLVADCECLLQYDPRLPEVIQLSQRLQSLL
ncbi:SET domain-containing protein SmydA-8 isoform X1 [Procambarus clarkii]|uniref:SET domain-containing protein SmydA-8 isoform X1 n=1 Tax=Procambarus clarkii TaxID=6728 RepID=UPI003742D4AB